MIGAIIGDIVGSRFEFHNIKSKEFELFSPRCFFTDDTVMTLAVAEAVMNTYGDYELLANQAVNSMQGLGRRYPNAGYGHRFMEWIFDDRPHPYNSFGNGAAMRVSACGFAARSLEQVKHQSYNVTYVTHNHYEGIKGAEATASAIFLARSGSSREEIRAYIDKNYYPMDFTLDGIRDSYYFNESCQGTVPQALEAFFEANDFEDAIRNAVSVGGDSDTLAAITGGIAEAYFGVPDRLREEAIKYLSPELLSILNSFEALFGTR